MFYLSFSTNIWNLVPRILFSRILSSAQDYAILVQFLNVVELLIYTWSIWSSENVLYHLGTSSQRANWRGGPWNICTWFIGSETHTFPKIPKILHITRKFSSDGISNVCWKAKYTMKKKDQDILIRISSVADTTKTLLRTVCWTGLREGWLNELGQTFSDVVYFTRSLPQGRSHPWLVFPAINFSKGANCSILSGFFDFEKRDVCSIWAHKASSKATILFLTKYCM